MSGTTIRVGQDPDLWRAQAHYLDGRLPQPQSVTLSIDEDRGALKIENTDMTLRWALPAIREVPDQAGGDILVLRLRDDPLQRVILQDRSVAVRFPNLRARAPLTRRKPLFLWALAAIASVALIILVLVPRMADQLATFIPPEGERALGETTLDQIRSGIDQTSVEGIGLCENPEGLAALRKMEATLENAMDAPLDLSVHVLDHGMVNAFALPGGYVVFFRGLIDKATAPEQVAAVFAHEIGHVVSRDPTRHALRSAGSIGVLGLLFGDFAGGALVLFLTEQLINAQYSQAAELAADDFAHDLLPHAGVSPAALADMFEAFGASGSEPPAIQTHFMSHPAMANRISGAREAVPPDFSMTPILSDKEWRALKSICDD